MGYTNKQIDPPKIYCSICMRRCRATKTLAMTLYAQMQSHQNFHCDFCTMQSHQNFHCDWNKQLMCKCEDKTSKTTWKHNQHKMLKLREVIAQSPSPNSLLFWTHSTNFLPEFYLVAEVGVLWLQNIFSYKPVLAFSTELMAIFNSRGFKS